MKILNKFSPMAALAGAALLAFTACSDDIDYSPGTYPNAPDRYFYVQDVVEYNVGADDTQLLFNVYRVSEDAPSVVDFQWTGDTEIFGLPQSVTFEEGDVEAQGVISLDASLMEPMKEYNVKVEIPGTQTTPYTQSYIDFKLMYVPMTAWEPFGYDPELGRDGLGAYSFGGFYFAGVEDPVMVESRHGLLNEELVEYRFSWLIDNDDPDLGWAPFLTASSSDGGQTIFVPAQPVDYDPSYGTVYVSDMYTYTGNDSYFSGSYFDPLTGTFNLNVIYYVDAGYWGYGYETCTLNGYLDTNDYTVTLNDLGLVTIGGENYQIISINWLVPGMVKYSVVEAASLLDDTGNVSEPLLNDLAAKISSGEVESMVANKPGNYEFSFAKPGNYTLVAVGYKNPEDKDFKSVQYVTFSYVAADPNAGWNSLGWVEYTDGYMDSLYECGVLTYFVEVQESESTPGLYRLVDPYGADFPWNEPGDWDDAVTSYLYIDATDPSCVSVPWSPQTVDWGDGPLTCWSFVAAYQEQGVSNAEIIEEGVAGTLKDKKITFPSMSLLSYVGNDGPYYGNWPLDEDDEIGPFLVDFNTLTSNPDAVKAVNNAAKAKAKRAGALRGFKARKAAKAVGKGARVARFSSKAIAGGSRKPSGVRVLHHSGVARK